MEPFEPQTPEEGSAACDSYRRRFLGCANTGIPSPEEKGRKGKQQQSNTVKGDTLAKNHHVSFGRESWLTKEVSLLYWLNTGTDTKRKPAQIQAEQKQYGSFVARGKPAPMSLFRFSLHLKRQLQQKHVNGSNCQER